MKTWAKLLIGLGVTAFLLGVIVGVVIVANISWVLFWVVFGLFIVIWTVISSIMIYAYLKRKGPLIEKLDLEATINLAKHNISHNIDNPDNFKIIGDSELHMVGESGSEMTPVRVLRGVGTEIHENIVCIYNLEDPRESTELRDPSEEKVKEMIIKISKRQPHIETFETIPGGVDSFGMPLPSRMRTTRLSRSEASKKQEDKEAEDSSAI